MSGDSSLAPRERVLDEAQERVQVHSRIRVKERIMLHKQSVTSSQRQRERAKRDREIERKDSPKDRQRKRPKTKKKTVSVWRIQFTYHSESQIKDFAYQFLLKVWAYSVKVRVFSSKGILAF